MAEVRFYTDEHVPRAVIEGLRYHGVDVPSTPEAGPEAGTMAELDEEHLTFALQQGRVLYTQRALHAGRGLPQAGGLGRAPRRDRLPPAGGAGG